MSYHVALRSEEGRGLNGSVLFYNAAGEILGEAGIHEDGTEIGDAEIPAETTYYRFVVDGYYWYGTPELYDSNTITLVKETPIMRYLLLGGLGVAAGYLLIKFLKF